MTPPDRTRNERSAADEYLAVAHLEPDLVERSIRGGVVTLLGQGVKVLVQAVAIVVLARLLAPAEFGQFAMVAAFLAALELFKDLGLSTATVQRRDLALSQVSTLFWLNAGLGLAVAGVMAALAPALTWLYDEPVLLSITPVVAVAFLFTGLAAQHLALLRRQMRFTTVTLLQVGAEIAALVAAVAAAYAGYGVWALVVQRLTWAAATAIGAWAACGWRPGRPGPLSEVRGFISFGLNATGSMVVSYLAGNLDKVLIGWYWGAAPLGMFERAQRLLMLPIRNLNVPLANVALATLSRLLDQPARYRETYIAAVERLAMVIVPLGGLFIAAAGPIIGLVLGSQWTDAVPILAWMGVTTIYMPVTYTLSWLYMSQDRTPEMLRAGLYGSALTIIAILCGLPFGPVGIAAAYAISGMVVRAPLLFWLVARQGPVGLRDLYALLAMPTSAGAAVGGAVWAARMFLPLDTLPAPTELALLFAVALLAALAVYAAFPRGRRAIRSMARLPGLFRQQQAGSPGTTAKV